ncbi:MAG: slr1658 superfamily regulator [Parvibaculaceae bacterium]
MRKHFGATSDESIEGTSLRLKLFDGPLEMNWAHCGATAEFLGDFNGALAATHKLDANDARHSIGYLANELIENAVKFRADGDVILSTSLEGDEFTFRLTNDTSAATAAGFENLLGELTSRDPGDLLIERIEANALDPDSSGSGLGILTLMNDYGARIGWDFSQETDAANVRIQTVAALTLT